MNNRQIIAYPGGGFLSLFAVSLGIGLSAGLSTVLLAMALACEEECDAREMGLPDEYRGSSREWGGLSQRTAGGASASDPRGADNMYVTSLQAGQASGAILVVLLWMLVKAAGQGSTHYVEYRSTVMNGGRLEMMMAAAGCIFGAYVCARVCAGRFDKTPLTERDPEAEAALLRTVRPFALALMINSICSTVMFPRLLDSAPSKYGVQPDWLATDLTLFYSVADLAGRMWSKDFLALFQADPAVREWMRQQGQQVTIWVATVRGAVLSVFILCAIACGWQDDSLLVIYVSLTGASHGLLSLGFMQMGARASKALGWQGQGDSTGLHLISASAFAVGEALGSLIGFLLSLLIWV